MTVNASNEVRAHEVHEAHDVRAQPMLSSASVARVALLASAVILGNAERRGGRIVPHITVEDDNRS